VQPADRQARQTEVQAAREAKAMLENPVVGVWKEEQKAEIMAQLLNAAPGYLGDADRLHAQARLQALNALASSLNEKVQTGMMAEKQIAEDKRKQERKNLRVANG
jgi:hypothetical protein